MYRETGEVHTGFWWGNPRERDYLENPGTSGWITLKHIWKWDGRCMDWIDLAQNRDCWPALVNVVMKFRVP
jgi:hypothetical protein